MDGSELKRLYLRKLEQWARAVVDEQHSFLEALHSLARRAQRERMVASGEWEFDRWFTRAHLLLVSIRNVWRFASALRQLDPMTPGLGHIGAFEDLVGSAAQFRDFLEHFDDYARGVGRAQKGARLPMPDDLGGMSMDSEEGFRSIHYTFGGLTVNLDDAATAAIAMAQMILGRQLIRPERMAE